MRSLSRGAVLTLASSRARWGDTFVDFAGDAKQRLQRRIRNSRRLTERGPYKGMVDTFV
jgi:hypothetical protein